MMELEWELQFESCYCLFWRMRDGDVVTVIRYLSGFLPRLNGTKRSSRFHTAPKTPPQSQAQNGRKHTFTEMKRLATTHTQPRRKPRPT